MRNIHSHASRITRENIDFEATPDSIDLHRSAILSGFEHERDTAVARFDSRCGRTMSPLSDGLGQLGNPSYDRSFLFVR